MLSEGGPQPGQETLAGLRHRDRPRRARQEAEPEALFERLHGVTHRRAADAEPDRGLGETALLGDDGKHRERAQILTRPGIGEFISPLYRRSGYLPARTRIRYGGHVTEERGRRAEPHRAWAKEPNMKRLRVLAIVFLLLTVAFGAALLGHQDRATSDRDRFVGAWRLAWMEEPGPDGTLIRRADRKGTLMYTRDGRMSVQIQFPDVAVIRVQRLRAERVRGLLRHLRGGRRGEDHDAPCRGLDHARARRTEPDARVPLRRRAPDHAFSPAGGTLVGHVGALLTAGSLNRR